ncbi:cytochrome P450 [Tanacetum coccineum]
MTIVLGDFNEVRIETERLGYTFCKRGAKLFNDFIYKSQLVDLPMGGRKFTRMNKFGTKLSKIDHILVCNRFISKWPNEQLMELPRELSDHCPLVQRTHSDNYGPIPFKFFNSWLSHGEFPTIVSQSWSKLEVAKWAGRAAKLEVFDTKAENGGLEGQEIEERLAIMKQLEDMDHFIRLDLLQKYKIKWDIDGDEN